MIGRNVLNININIRHQIIFFTVHFFHICKWTSLVISTFVIIDEMASAYTPGQNSKIPTKNYNKHQQFLMSNKLEVMLNAKYLVLPRHKKASRPKNFTSFFPLMILFEHQFVCIRQAYKVNSRYYFKQKNFKNWLNNMKSFDR